MPTLLDAANAFSKLGKRSVAICEAACVRVRHRGASCDECLLACTHDAIAIDANAVSIDNALCTGCGACASVCPTEALTLIEDANAAAKAAIDELAAASMDAPMTTPDESSTPLEKPVLALVCEFLRNQRTPVGKRDERSDDSTLKDSAEAASALDGAQELVVSCLSALDESTLIHAACAGVKLRYFSADCADCPNAEGGLIERTALRATEFLNAFAKISGTNSPLSNEQVPPTWLQERPSGHTEKRDTSPELTRRGMLDHLVERTNDSIAEAAVGTLSVMDSSRKEKPKLARSLLRSDGTMRQFVVARNASVLDDLFKNAPHFAEKTAEASLQESDATNARANGSNGAPLLPTRLFGEVHVDASACDLCGICMRFCPTGALCGTPMPPTNPFVAATRSIEVKGELDFRANDCVACGLCADVCPKRALELRSGIAAEDLFALEPRVLLKR